MSSPTHWSRLSTVKGIDMTKNRALSCGRALLALAALASLPALAASHTWSGAVNGDFSNAGNWSAGGAPANGETAVQLVFPAGATTLSMTNDVTGLAVTSIDFQATGYTLAGNGFDLDGTVGVSAGGMYEAANISAPIALTGACSFVAAQNLYLRFQGVLSGTGEFTTSSTGGSGGYVFLTAANTFTGVVTAASGYLIVANAQALGFADGTPATGTVVQNASLSLGSFTIAGEALSLGGQGANGNGAIQSAGSVWSGPVTLTSDTVLVALNGPLLISGDIGDGGNGYGITFRATEGITLSGNNSYGGAGVGPDRIEYGTVIVNGNGFATLETSYYGSGGGALRGTGSLGQVVAGGAGATDNVIAPGTVAATGVLSPTSLTMNANSTLAIRINGPVPGTGHDQIQSAGETVLNGGALSVSLGYLAPVGTVFTILSNGEGGGVTGTFAGLPNGATLVSGGETLQIAYGVGAQSSDITLTVTSLTPVALQEFTAE